jgi:hypothetical protein
MGAIDITTKVRAAANAAIERECLGEDYAFDCSVSALQHTAGLIVVYTLVISARSPLLGQGPLMNVAQIQSPNPDDHQVETAVTDAIHSLRELSTKILSGQNGHKPGLLQS